MPDKQTHNHIPALRFPDFVNDGEWEVKKLGDVCKLTNGMAFKPSDWKTSGVPIVRIQNLNDEKADFNYCDSEIIDEKCLIDSGTLLFSWSGTPGTSFGAYIWNRGKAVLNQHIFIVDPIGIDRVFLKMTIDANMTKIIEKSHGGAGLRHITKSDLEEIPIFVPNRLSEQQHIAACLSAVDELLTSTNGKLEQLKTYKKSLIQKFFPAKEKKLPELRFKEFEKDGEWVEKKFGEIISVNSGRDYKHLNYGNIPVYGTGGYMLSVDDKLSDIDAVGIGRKGTIDKPQYLKAPFWTVDTLFFLTNQEGFDIQFIYYLSKTIPWKKYGEQTGVPSLSKLSIENLDVVVPPTILEQRKIVQTILPLDEELDSLSKKIVLLENQKKGLMQQLLIC